MMLHLSSIQLVALCKLFRGTMMHNSSNQSVASCNGIMQLRNDILQFHHADQQQSACGIIKWHHAILLCGILQLQYTDQQHAACSSMHCDHAVASCKVALWRLVVAARRSAACSMMQWHRAIMFCGTLQFHPADQQHAACSTMQC